MSSIIYLLSQIAAVIYSCMASAYAALWLFGMSDEVGLMAIVIAICAAGQWLGVYLLRPVDRPVAALYRDRTAVECAVLSACISYTNTGMTRSTDELFAIAHDEMDIYASEHELSADEAERHFEALCDQLEAEYAELCR